MKCLLQPLRLESDQFSYKTFCIIHLCLNLCAYTCFVYLQPFCVTLDSKKPIIDSIHIQSLLYLLLWFGVFNYKTCRNTSKDLGHNSRTSFR